MQIKSTITTSYPRHKKKSGSNTPHSSLEPRKICIARYASYPMQCNLHPYNFSRDLVFILIVELLGWVDNIGRLNEMVGR